MTTPTIEEMVETYWTAWNKSGDADPVIRDDDVFVDIRAGLLAVIEKHIGPMLGDAHVAGTSEMAVFSAGGQSPEMSFAYAARKLAQLKGQSK